MNWTTMFLISYSTTVASKWSIVPYDNNWHPVEVHESVREMTCSTPALSSGCNLNYVVNTELRRATCRLLHLVWPGGASGKALQGRQRLLLLLGRRQPVITATAIATAALLSSRCFCVAAVVVGCTAAALAKSNVRRRVRCRRNSHFPY